jgi:SAM-dependent methyltransferase
VSITLSADIDTAWFGSSPDSEYYRNAAAQLAAGIRGRFSTGTVLVAGCGHGHLVNQLAASGYTAWGVDISAYAVAQAKAHYPALSARFLQGDCRVAAQMATVRQTVLGGPASRRFNIVIAEDLDSAQGTLAVLDAAWLDNHPEASALGVTVHTPQTIAAGDAEVAQCRSALGGILANNGAYVHVTSMREPENPALYYGPGLWHTPTEWRVLVGTDPLYRIPDLVEIP